MKLLIFALLFLTNIFDTARELVIKSAVNSLKTSPTNLKEVFSFIMRLMKVPQLWLGLLFSILALILWLLVLTKADLNYAFSLDSMHYIFTAIVAQKFLKEKIGWNRWCGIILITIGIAVVSLS